MSAIVTFPVGGGNGMSATFPVGGGNGMSATVTFPVGGGNGMSATFPVGGGNGMSLAVATELAPNARIVRAAKETATVNLNFIALS